MEKVEVRVRPVIRHVVTRFTNGTTSDGMSYGSCETLGEFDSENYAEVVAGAMREKAAEREYVIVESTLGEVQAMVWHAQDEKEAVMRQHQAQQETGKTFRVYSRIVHR